ncbi:MAG: glycosyltransferase family 9 protein, partial [Desulfobacterales bacterium]|nr:glycosyltransferase family 9 protein [Desulfobacterales bacterium]
MLNLDFMERLIKRKISPKAKILLIKLRSIGDVVYNTAVYAPLKKSFPDAHLTVLVERPSYGLVCDHPDVDEVLCFDKGSLWGQMRFYWRLMRQRYDVAIDMHEGARGAMMCFLTRAPLRIGHKFAKRSFLYTAGLEFSDLDPKFPIDYQVALIQKMGVTFDCVKPTIHISSSAQSRAKNILLGQGIDSGDKFCVIHPGTRKVYDQWQYNKFARLAEVFHAQYGLKVLVTCGPGEEQQAQA